MKRLRRRLRVARRLAGVVLHVGWGVALVALAFPVLGDARRDRVITAWARRLLRILGIDTRLAPAPQLPGGALVVCNHVSWVDIYLIHAARRVHFVSKAEVRRWPVAGWLAHKTGTLFLQRARRADTARIGAEMGSLMAHGEWVALFPEGTTGDGHSLKRFLPSLLQPAVKLHCPIVPAALRYRSLAGDYTAAPAYVEGVNLWQSFLRIAGEPGLIGELRFGDPLPPTAHRRELAAVAQDAVAALLGLNSPESSSAGTARQTPRGPRA